MTVQSNCVIVAQIHILVKSDKFRFLSIIPAISFLLFPITSVSHCWLLTHTAHSWIGYSKFGPEGYEKIKSGRRVWLDLPGTLLTVGSFAEPLLSSGELNRLEKHKHRMLCKILVQAYLK